MADAAIVAAWAADHLNLIGWPVLLTLCWKFKGAFDSYFNNIEEVRLKTREAADIGKKIQQELNTVQTNHLVHLSQDMKEIHDIYDRHTDLLTSIDRGIAVLVDRGKSKSDV